MKEYLAWQEITNNLRREIEMSKKSKAEIARAVGLSRTTISGYCSGYSFPNLYILRKICFVLDCSYEDILGKPVPAENETAI